ncbi:MAG: FtsX-like permease family protein [Ruminococcaceae bacterium]|nr:FtsX-like permease family protein [Oscillospiraceae bacterium]
MVKPGSSFFKDFRRTLLRSITRFLSIMAITALGVGFFAGINATEPDMVLSADRYFQAQQLADFNVISPLGFLPDQIEKIRKLPGVATVQPGYSSDLFLVRESGARATVRLSSYGSSDQLDQPILLEGRLPKASDELVIEAGSELFQSSQNGHANLYLGETLTAVLPDGNTLRDTLTVTTFTLVGFIQSPRYISFDRGQTRIGDGNIDAYALVHPDAFALERESQVSVRTTDSSVLSAYTAEYEAHLIPLEAQMADLGKSEVGAETQQLRDELTESKETLLQEKQKAEKEIADAREKLAEATLQIEQGEQELLESEKSNTTELEAQKNRLDQGRASYLDGMMQYIAGYDEWLAGFLTWQDKRDALNQADQELADAKNQLDQAERDLNLVKEHLDQAEEQLALLQDALQALRRIRQAVPDQSPGLSEAEFRRLLDTIRAFSPELAAYVEAYYDPADQDMMLQLADFLDSSLIQVEQAEKEGRTQYEAGLAEYKTGLQTLNQSRSTYESNRRKADQGMAELARAKTKIDAGKEELDRARQELDQAKKEIDDGEITLIRAELRLKEEIAKGRSELAVAKTELVKTRETLNRQEREALRKIAAAEEEIRLAERQLVEIPQQWFIYTRDINPGYSGYGDDARRIGSVARVFPLFFFLVAALVCLTTMTRMVEEERVQIGTLKALGYSNLSIAMKYLLYALLASLAGSVAGLWAGFTIFPATIMQAYDIMYQLPAYYTPVHLNIGLLSVGMALVTTLAATLGASLNELKAVPAVLMQPKAPRPGKRIFLEYIRPLWQKLSFSQKLAARNVFRYKQRLFMTVIGIAGCTALLLTGFGLKDSISIIVDKQFGEIFLYDGQIVFDTDQDDAARKVDQILSEHPDISSHVLQLSESVTLLKKHVSLPYSATLIVTDPSASLSTFYDLHERTSGHELPLTGSGAVISEKLASLLALRPGDTLTYSDTENRTYSVQVNGIAENYLAHYIFMSAETFDHLTFREPDFNTAAFIADDPSALAASAFKETILEQDMVLGSFFTDSLADDFAKSIGSLNLVVMLLIAAAAALAFVVLYNLISINITERKREIATIKVLGFRDLEVSAYVFRENIILTALGTLAGLLLGLVLHRFVMDTMEIDAIMFGKSIHWLSYLYATLLTVLFSTLVNAFMHIRLRRIKMATSMKSAE